MAVAEIHSRVMASRLHLIASDPTDGGPAGRVDAALRDVVSYLRHLEDRWSRFIPTSDISRINALGPTGGGVLSVDPSTLTLLGAMIEGYQVTAGRFDPTVLRAVIAEGYSASHLDPDLVCQVPAATMWASASLHDLELDPCANTVTVPAGLVVDPGGIGKGLAADLAVARLLDAGVAGAMVEIGGDLAMGGVPVDPAGWLVDVEHPDPADGLLCALAISGGGVATSSTRSRRWTRDGVERHHQIDPVTERSSSTDLDAVTVIASAAWLAEVHATAALAAGSGDAVAYLDGHGLSGIAVPRASAGCSVLSTGDLAGIDMRPRSGAR
ncbi:MAG: FAD:protein FMN transferase [Acidimicrobiales bacterium]